MRALTQDRRHHIGYLPRYLAADVHALGLKNIVARVERVNRPPVPVQFRVLCELTAPWPEGFDPCTAVEFQPVTSPVARV